jgi:hypothetical protein
VVEARSPERRKSHTDGEHAKQERQHELDDISHRDQAAACVFCG